MSQYSNIYKYMFGESKANNDAAGFEVNNAGINISPAVPAEPGEYKEFGFVASAGFTYTFASAGGVGSGTLTSSSAALFPITGDDKPYVVTVRIDTVDNHRFELAIEATTI